MMKHLLKLIWNRKRSNLLMIIEIFFSFLVLFAISGLLIYNLTNYFKPLGFEYKDVWSINLRPVEENVDGLDSQAAKDDALVDKSKTKLKYQNILKQLEAYPQIEAFSASWETIPYSFYTSMDLVTYKDIKSNPYIFKNDDHYPQVVGLEIVEGRWFNSSDDASRLEPLVINQYLKDIYFKDEPAIGKVLNRAGKEYLVVGVVSHYRAKGEYSAPEGITFYRINPVSEDNWEFSNILIKVKPGVGADFEEKMVKDLAAIVPGWSFEVSTIESIRKTKNKVSLIPMIALSLIGGFLIINVVLGLFGVLWYNINRRYSEIGLRRASGATSGMIQKQFIGEVMVLVTFGVIVGCFIALQFPLLNVFNIDSSIYLWAIFVSVIAIYLLGVLCAWYPGWQASKIEPAVALHEE